MSEFLFSYGLFFAKILTVLIAAIVLIGILSSGKNKQDDDHLKVTSLNRFFDQLKHTLMGAVMDKKEFKHFIKAQKKANKSGKKSNSNSQRKPRLYVLEFDGDIKASETDSLRQEVTALLSVAEAQDEVLLKLYNAGGMVHEHGFAASQLKRLRDAKLHLTVAVDKVAASGGYMMACVADKIIAAPFAIIGSIGVLAQLPNFNRLLDKAGIDFEQHTAGEYKRTVTMFGKNSEKERDKLKLDLKQTHHLFKQFIADHRSKLDLEEVATGEYWYGTKALELNLIDEVRTSDEHLMQASEEFDIYKLKMERKQALQDKILKGLFSSWARVTDKLSNHKQQQFL